MAHSLVGMRNTNKKIFKPEGVWSWERLAFSKDGRSKRHWSYKTVYKVAVQPKRGYLSWFLLGEKEGKGRHWRQVQRRPRLSNLQVDTVCLSYSILHKAGNENTRDTTLIFLEIRAFISLLHRTIKSLKYIFLNPLM